MKHRTFQVFSALRGTGLSFVALWALTVTPLSAQTPTGGIEGTVKDPSGGVVMGAKVQVTETTTGQALNFTTASAGFYSARNLNPGVYNVRVEASGFSTTIIAGMKVDAGAVVNGNVTLEIGQTSSVVEVQAELAAVDTVRQTVDTVITTNEIKNLPLFGRNFLDLATLAPGVSVRDGNAIDPTKSNTYRTVGIAGRSGTGTRVSVDGIDITDETVGTTTTNLSQDSVNEFQLTSSSLDVSTSLTSSGAISIISKQGGNTLHGTGFFDYYNQDMSARQNYETGSQETSRKRYGAGAGGAFIKNKLFYYGNLEKQDQQSTNIAHSVLFPQYNGSTGLPLTNQLALGRVDWVINSRLNAFYSFRHSDDLSTGGGVLSPYQNVDRANTHTAGLTAAFARWTHNIRFGVVNFINHIDSSELTVPFPTFGGQAYQMNINGLSVGPNSLAPQQTYQRNYQLNYEGSYLVGKHSLRFGGGWTKISLGGFANFAGPTEVNMDYNDGEAAAIKAAGLDATDPLNFPLSDFQVGPNAGYFTAAPAFGLPHGGHFNDRISFYGQDSYKLSRRFTLNVGVRWEYDTQYFGDPNVKRDPVFDQWVAGASKTPRLPKDLFSPSLGFAYDVTGSGKNVVRGGFYKAYEMNIFNNTMFDQYNNMPPGIGPDTYTSAYVSGPDGTPINVDGKHPDGDYTDLQGQTARNVLPTIIAINSAVQKAYSSYKFDPNSGTDVFHNSQGISYGGIFPGNQFKIPYSLQFNLGFQRELKPGLVASVDWIYNHGVGTSLLMQDAQDRRDASTLDVNAASAKINSVLKGQSVDSYLSAHPSAGISSFGLVTDGIWTGKLKVDNILRARFIRGGFNKYNALHFSLRGRLPSNRVLKDSSLTIGYALSESDAPLGNTRGEFIARAPNNRALNDPNYFGPNGLDHTHNITASHMGTLPLGFRLSTIWSFSTPAPGNLVIPNLSGFTSGTSAVFANNVNGDYYANFDILPNTKAGQWGRSIKNFSDLNKAISDYNANFAGKLTPYGQALLSAGLFTQSQLVRMGAVTPTIAPIPAGNPSPFHNFFNTDVRLSRPIKVKERITVSPFLDIFNVFNHSAFAGYPAAGLDGSFGSLNYDYANAAPGSQASDLYFQQGRQTSGGAVNPRRIQFGVRVDF